MIKLFEQWLAEEDAQISKSEGDSSAKTSGSETLKVTTSDKSFEVEVTPNSEKSSELMDAYKVSNSNNDSIKSGAMIMIAKTPNKDGKSDIVVLNDQNKPEDALNYSGKVEKTKA